MFRLLLIFIAGSLLVGCTGQAPDSSIVVDAVRSVSTAAEQQTESSVQEQTTRAATVIEETVTEGTVMEETDIEETNTDEIAKVETDATEGSILPGIQLFTFADGEPRWYTVDDNVMGGVSSSIVGVVEPDILAFVGTMSMENNGGFASARSEGQAMNLSETDGILLRVLGDGNTYRLRIRTTTTGPRISYNARFETTPGQWEIVYIPYETMVPTSFGYVMDVGPVDTANIGSFGLMLSDEQPGEFQLLVDWLYAVSEEELLALSS